MDVKKKIRTKQERNLQNKGKKGFTQERYITCPSICIFWIMSFSNQ